MSLATFKRKSGAVHGSRRSGKSPGGVWMSQGPFGSSRPSHLSAVAAYGPTGFSVNGGHRNVGGVGRDMKMSQSGTPFRGVHAVGFGGTCGRYPVAEPVLNAQSVQTQGTQYAHIKPSVLSNAGMLAKRYRWAWHGQYPNHWVQPTGAPSQSTYVAALAADRVQVLDVNNVAAYEGEDALTSSGPRQCKGGRSTAKHTYDTLARQGAYAKSLHVPVTYETYTQHLTRSCANPIGAQKPFPFAVPTGTGYSVGGTSVRSFGNACGAAARIYVAAPEWYTRTLA